MRTQTATIIPDNPDDGQAPIFDVWTDLDAIAVWARANGQGELHPFRLPVTDGMSDKVREAVQRLNAYTLEGLFPHDPIPADGEIEWHPDSGEGHMPEPVTLSQTIEHAISMLDDREFEVLTRRVLTDRPETADDVAARCGIGRDRVRKMEKSLRLRLQAILETHRIEEKLEALFDQPVPFLTTVQACDRMPELGEQLEGLSMPLHRVFRMICRTPFEVCDGWIASPSIMFARQEFLETLRAVADEHGIVGHDVLERFDIRSADGEPTGTVDQWLERCGIVTINGGVIVCAQQRDAVKAVLRLEGHPMSPEEIASLLHEDDVAGVQDDLRTDPGLMGVGGGRWTLRD